MELAKFEYFFSKPRLARYISACNGDNNKGLCLYKYNLQASQSLYPLISILEVSLRNGIDRELSKHFDDADWLMNQRSELAEHPKMVKKNSKGDLVPDRYFSIKLKKAEEALRFRKEPINHGRLLTEMTFGFWVKFFDTGPIKILKGVPLQAFANKPGINLTNLHSHLKGILDLRNRISHNEPICFDYKGSLCINTISQYESGICDAINWIDSDLGDWAEKMNFFRPILNRLKLL